MDAAESITGSTAETSARIGPEPQRQHQAASSEGSSQDPGTTLSERDHAVLAFERQWWKYPGKKEQAIRELFGMSATRYYQILNRLIESREAMAADPMLIKRLRRARTGRSRTRAAKRLGIESR